MTDVTVATSTSYQSAGFLYAQASATKALSVVIQTSSGTNTFTDLISNYNNGGVFYVDAQLGTVTITGDTTFTNCRASLGSGGFAYVTNIDVFKIDGS